MIFVAVGEGAKGFKSPHLKLFGPFMIVLGFAVSLLWVIVLVLPSMMALHPTTMNALASWKGKGRQACKEKERVEKQDKDTKAVPDIKVTDTEDEDNIEVTNTDFSPGIHTISAQVERRQDIAELTIAR